MEAAIASDEIAAFPIHAGSARHEVVYVVDDDPCVRLALVEMLSALGRTVKCFSTAREYLESKRTAAPSCLILDVHLPDMSGLELQSLLRGGDEPPIVFISGRTDVPVAVRALKAGAIDFLTKPVSPKLLNGAIDAALAQDRQRRQVAQLRGRFELLTPREKEVLPLLVAGMLNKQVAARLGISDVTVQMHRTQIMRKMEARSFAELIRMAEKLEVLPRDSGNPQSRYL